MVIQTVLYSQDSLVQPLEDYLSTYQKIRPYTSGEDLKARGLPPSSRYESILSRLKAAWLDGEIHSFDEEIELLNQLLEKK